MVDKLQRMICIWVKVPGNTIITLGLCKEILFPKNPRLLWKWVGVWVQVSLGFFWENSPKPVLIFWSSEWMFIEWMNVCLFECLFGTATIIYIYTVIILESRSTGTSRVRTIGAYIGPRGYYSKWYEFNIQRIICIKRIIYTCVPYMCILSVYINAKSGWLLWFECSVHVSDGFPKKSLDGAPGWVYFGFFEFFLTLQIPLVHSWDWQG